MFHTYIPPFRVACAASFLLVLGACVQPKPEPQLTPAEAAEIEQARAELVAAECQLYIGTGITPDGC